MNITTMGLPTEPKAGPELMAGKLSQSKRCPIKPAHSKFIDPGLLARRHWQESLEAMAAVAEGKVVAADLAAKRRIRK